MTLTNVGDGVAVNAAALHPLPPKHMLTETYLRNQRLAMLLSCDTSTYVDARRALLRCGNGAIPAMAPKAGQWRA